MFEGSYSPPVYNDLYNFLNGAQDDIFQDSYVVLPDPAPDAALPVLRDFSVANTSSSLSDPTPVSPVTKPKGKSGTWFVCMSYTRMLLY